MLIQKSWNMKAESDFWGRGGSLRAYMSNVRSEKQKFLVSFQKLLFGRLRIACRNLKFENILWQFRTR